MIPRMDKTLCMSLWALSTHSTQEDTVLDLATLTEQALPGTMKIFCPKQTSTVRSFQPAFSVSVFQPPILLPFQALFLTPLGMSFNAH